MKKKTTRKNLPVTYRQLFNAKERTQKENQKTFRQSGFILFICLSLVMLTNLSFGQIYLNTFTGASNCPTNGNTPAMAANSTGTPVTRSTVTCNSTANVFNSTTLNATASISNTSYIEFSATANAGFQLNVTSLSFFRQASASAPNQLEVRYSTDGFASSTTWGAAPLSPTTGTVITWDFTDFSTSGAGTVTFRLYPYGTQRADLTAGAAAASGTFRVDDVTINGTVTTAAVTATLANITQPSGSIIQGNTNVVLAGFTVSSTGSTDFTAVTVTGAGSVTATDITTVRIFRDNDGNGAINGADASVSGAGVAYAASMPLTISGETGITTARNYLIVANVAGVGVSTPGNTVTTSIASGAFTTTATTNTGSATGNSRTIVAPPGTTTISAGAGTEPTTISSVINSQGAASLNFDFTILDDGATPATDGAASLISQIVLNAGTGNTVTDWSSVIAGAELNDGTNTTTSATIGTSSITFSGITNTVGALGYIADNASKTYTLKIWLNSSLSPALKLTIDGQRFVFRIQTADVTASGSGSQLANAQDVNSGSGNNLIDVIISALSYVQQPTSTFTGVVMSPDVTVAAVDANGNRDLGFTNQIRLTSSGTLSETPIDVAAVSGLATFTGLIHTASGTNLLLTAKRTATLDFTVNSSTFNITSLQFTAGNIAVLVAAANGSQNTTGSIVELNTTTAGQSPVNTFPINGTSGANALRFSGNATSNGYLANSDDRSLLCFTGHNTTTTSGNINAVTSRGVGTLGTSYNFNLATTYTGVSGNQTRCATSINSTNWFIGDQGGLYTNGASTAGPTNNFRGVKSFGGIVYAQSTAVPPIGTISAPSGGTLTGLPGLSATSTNLQDFYLVSSASNTTYDILYLVYTTGINKYSLVSGSWMANGSYSSLGGFGLSAEKQGSGANLYMSTGGGATPGNSVVKLFDAAGYNAAINITTANNVTLYTTASGTTIKGVAFAPAASGTPTHLAVTSVNGGNSPSANEPFSITIQAQDGANAPAVVSANTNIILSVATGSGALGGTLTGTINSGSTSVTLTGITYNTAETGVSITATRTSGDVLSTGTSVPFTVLGAATQLVFVTFPSVGYVNNAIAPFTIQVRRADNSVDLNYSSNVTVSLNSGTGAVSGTLSATPVNGIVSFNDLTFNASGSKVLAANSGSLGTVSSSITISTVTLTYNILPQFMQGLSGTNNSRVPFAYRVTISGLNPNSTYRYINQCDTLISTSTSGAGNIIFRDPSFFYRSTSASLASINSYGEFLTDGSGSYSGWFITEPTGNARFTPGKNLYMRIILNDGNGGSSAAIRLNTTNTVHVINFGATANDGTGLRGNSSASQRNFVFMYDNVSGTGRPIAGTYVELDGSDNIATPYVQFYSDDVNDINGAYGVIIPNNLPNGIRRIEQRDLTTGNIVGCPATDADGIWQSGANTVNPNTGTTPVVLTSGDAILDPTYSAPSVSSVTSNSPVCASSPLTLNTTATGTPAPTYSWSGIGTFSPSNAVYNPSVTGAATGNYTVTVTNYCGTSSSSISVTVNPLPTVSAGNVSGCAGSAIALSGSPAGGTFSVANPYTGPSTTYTYSYTDGNGCSNTSTAANIIVNPLPTVTAGNVSGCAGGAIALSGTPAGGTFSVANPYTGPSTTYTYSYTDGNGCSNTSTAATITVNPLPTVTAGNVSGCAGSAIALSGTPAGGTFSVANPYTGPSTTYTYSYTDGNGCSNTSAAANITVNARPTGALSGTTTICPGNSTAISIAATGVGTISGTLNPGNISYGGTASTIAVNVSPGTMTSYTINTMSDANCSSMAGDLSGGATVSIYTTATAPATVTSNDPDNEVCSGTNVLLTANGSTFGNAPGSSYKWYEGGCGTGAVLGSASTLNVINPSAGSHTYYSRIEDACGNSACASLTIIVTGAPPSNTVGAINAPAEACSGSTGILISVNTVGGPNIHYSWNTGTNSSVVLFSTTAGGPYSAGPFSTLTNSVYAQFGTLSGSNSGYNVCVQGVNACGSTNNKCVFIRGVVSTPGTITPAAGAVACPNDIKNYVCGVSGGTTVYNWTLNGSTAPITSGQGSTTPTVTFPVGFAGGNLCVTAALSCGGSSTSAPRCMSISNSPAMPATITGSATVCPGASGVSYSVPAVTGASGYNWIVPSGATIASGANTPSITVNFPASFAGASAVCVAATSSCASSAARCKTVTSGIPAQPAGVNGPTTNICSSTVQYSVVNPPAGVTYTWTNPAGTTITGGQGSATIQMNVSNTFNSGYLTVVANSVSCAPATSPARSVTLFGKPNLPSVITAFPASWCNGGFPTFSVTSLSPQPTNNWTVSNGTITAGQSSTTIDVTWGTGTGTVSVSASNTCGVSSGTRTQSFTGTVCREEGMSSAGAFSVYPNPAHDKVTVSIDVKDNANYSMQLMDLSGRVVLSDNQAALSGLNIYDLNLSHVSKGVYTLEVKSANDNWKTKVVVV